MQCLVKWWAEYPGPLLQERVVNPLQQYLTDELFVTKKLTVSVMNVIKVLAKVEEANQLGRQLPPEAFYNELIRSASLTAQVCSTHCCCPLCRLVWNTLESGIAKRQACYNELVRSAALTAAVPYTDWFGTL